MTPFIDYYLAPNSPWTYLGHDRLASIAQRAGMAIRVKPIDLGGQVFPVSGGIPLGQRAPQRQAYRLVELKRFGAKLNIPINIQPRYFPIPGNPAAAVIVAAQLSHGDEQAMALTGAIMTAVWVHEQDISDPDTLAAIVQACGLPPDTLANAESAETIAAFQANTDEAIAAGIFGSPTYSVAGELFWGQDRLELLEWHVMGQ